MTDFLLGATLFVLAMVALGLVCILRGPRDVDRMLSAQLFGTGGIAALLLLGVAADVPAVLDVALTVGVLAAFSAIAFVQAGTPSAPGTGEASGVDGNRGGNDASHREHGP